MILQLLIKFSCALPIRKNAFSKKGVFYLIVTDDKNSAIILDAKCDVLS